MKFIGNQEELLFLLQSAAKIVPPRTSIDYLEGIYLKAEGKYLKIAATNLEAGIKNFLPVKVEEEGRVVLPPKFADIVRLSGGKELEVQVDENYNAHIYGGNSRFLLKGIDPQDFPQLPQWEGEEDWSIKTETFKSMVRHSLISVSHDEGKPALTGVLFKVEGNRLTLVSTDSFRLTIRKGRIENPGDNKGLYLIPLKVLSELIKFNFSQDTIKVKIVKNQVLFKVDDFLFISRLLDEKFPQVERIIPDKYNTFFKVARNDLISSLQRVMLISEGNNYIFKIRIQGGNMLLSSNSEMGSIEEEIKGNKEGEDMELYLNSRFLLDSLRAMEEEEAAMNFTGSTGPLIFDYKGDEEEFFHLILPIKS
ncbi:MAG: DNA polymerase III subunit beta [Candidatus Syntrophonatronum acetioxidans]|uniref:Beta sliding clamp n=1 Tax=Candidatus Syntrophonatronum acetioxidans TaxID=1795816 RepID=A0A424YB22_9FIRM|nr:MAG: DNA polymerase III subunit beta [Candidatus Syntrophonatronum acetioxidans]